MAGSYCWLHGGGLSVARGCEVTAGIHPRGGCNSVLAEEGLLFTAVHPHPPHSPRAGCILVLGPGIPSHAPPELAAFCCWLRKASYTQLYYPQSWLHLSAGSWYAHPTPEVLIPTEPPLGNTLPCVHPSSSCIWALSLYLYGCKSRHAHTCLAAASACFVLPSPWSPSAAPRDRPQSQTRPIGPACMRTCARADTRTHIIYNINVFG